LADSKGLEAIRRQKEIVGMVGKLETSASGGTNGTSSMECTKQDVISSLVRFHCILIDQFQNHWLLALTAMT
jgi:hypothetical protein